MDWQRGLSLFVCRECEVVPVKRVLMVIALALALPALVACGKPTEEIPTPTAVPVATDTPIVVATEAPPTTPEIPVGDVNVALALLKLPESEIVAVVNGVEVPTSRYRAELGRQLVALTDQYQLNWNDPETIKFLPEIQDNILEQLIDQTLLPQLGASEGVSVPAEEVEAEVVALKERMLGDGQFQTWAEFLEYNAVTDEEVFGLISNSLLVELLVAAHGGIPASEQVKAAHILVAEETTAREVLAKLEDGESFATLAEQYSTDTGSKEAGGDLGWFPRGVMVPEFEEAAFTLDIGQTSDLVQSQFGYHIIQVSGQEVRPLEGDLAIEQQRMAFSEWYAAERERADVIKNIEFDLSE